MSKKSLILMAVICLLAVSPAAADQFNFTYTGGAFDAHGTFTADPLGGGAYLVTGLDGFQNGQTMTLLPVNSFASNDNLFFSSSPYFDVSGLSFQAGGINYNLFYYAGQPGFAVTNCLNQDCVTTDQYGVPSTPVTFSASPAPEPTSLALLASGLLGIGGLVRRKLKGA